MVLHHLASFFFPPFPSLPAFSAGAHTVRPCGGPAISGRLGRPYGGGGSPLSPLSRCARHLPLTGGVIPRPTAVRFFVAPDDPAGAGGCRHRKVVRGDSVDRGYLVCRPLIRHGLRPCHLPPRGKVRGAGGPRGPPRRGPGGGRPTKTAGFGGPPKKTRRLPPPGRGAPPPPRGNPCHPF